MVFEARRSGWAEVPEHSSGCGGRIRVCQGRSGPLAVRVRRLMEHQGMKYRSASQHRKGFAKLVVPAIRMHPSHDALLFRAG